MILAYCQTKYNNPNPDGKKCVYWSKQILTHIQNAFS